MPKIHRIYTEDVNRKALIELTVDTFDNFTVQPTTGYYQGEPEDSIVLEIVGANVQAIGKLAQKIRAMNGQKSVLVMSLPGETKRIRTSTNGASRK
jgi:hypothetical protein